MFDYYTISKQLGYYVYLLIDPSDNKPFYVGKGQGNRVFDHIRCAIENPEEKSEKLDKIREIGPENVKHVILTHGLKTEDEAFRIEAIVIDLLRYLGCQLETTLTNKQGGVHSHQIGLMTTDEIIRLYNAEPLNHISTDCVVININGLYERGMDSDRIYQATKEAWKIGKKRTSTIKYVLSEYQGLIIEVFKVDEWYPVERTYGVKCKKAGGKYTAFGFNGHIAEDAMRNLYINKSIANKKKKGRANPISYADSINK